MANRVVLLGGPSSGILPPLLLLGSSADKSHSYQWKVKDVLVFSFCVIATYTQHAFRGEIINLFKIIRKKTQIECERGSKPPLQRGLSVWDLYSNIWCSESYYISWLCVKRRKFLENWPLGKQGVTHLSCITPTLMVPDEHKVYRSFIYIGNPHVWNIYSKIQ